MSVNHLSRDPKWAFREFLRGGEKGTQGIVHVSHLHLCAQQPASIWYNQENTHRSLPTTPVLLRKMGWAAPCPDLVPIPLVLAPAVPSPVPAGKCREPATSWGP